MTAWVLELLARLWLHSVQLRFVASTPVGLLVSATRAGVVGVGLGPDRASAERGALESLERMCELLSLPRWQEAWREASRGAQEARWTRCRCCGAHLPWRAWHRVRPWPELDAGVEVGECPRCHNSQLNQEQETVQ